MGIRSYLATHFDGFQAPLPREREHAGRNAGPRVAPAPASPPADMQRSRYSSLLQINFMKKKVSERTPEWEQDGCLTDNNRSGLLLRQLRIDSANIAAGGFGSISTFSNENGDKLVGKVAIKKRFEAGLSTELDAYRSVYEKAGEHPNLVKVYGMANVPDAKGKLRRTLLMDAVPGASGSKIFADLRKCWEVGSISNAEYWGAIQYIGRSLIDVSEHINKAGVVHNDIKPDNFIVHERTGEPVLIDLGLASKVNEPIRHGGTIGFSSPEAEDGTGVDVRSDLLGVAATLLSGAEGNTGRFPNQGLQRRNSHNNDGRREPGTYAVNTAYTFFMQTMLAEDPELRFPPNEARDLDFIHHRMLDDHSAREVLKKVITLGGMEANNPTPERLKTTKPRIKPASPTGTNAATGKPIKSGVGTNGDRLRPEGRDVDLSARESMRPFELKAHLEQRLKAKQLEYPHRQLPLRGLNVMLLEESILESIQMGISDHRSWTVRVEKMGNSLDWLKNLGPEQMRDLSAPHKDALEKILQNILTEVGTQQASIEELLHSPNSEISNNDWENVRRAGKLLHAVEMQVERLSALNYPKT